MRTTLTLDDDVAALLEKVRQQRGSRLREIVNVALRRGLIALERDDDALQEPYRVRPLPLGRPLLASYDDVADVLAYAEGEEFG